MIGGEGLVERHGEHHFQELNIKLIFILSLFYPFLVFRLCCIQTPVISQRRSLWETLGGSEVLVRFNSRELTCSQLNCAVWEKEINEVVVSSIKTYQLPASDHMERPPGVAFLGN